jgi:arylformamidase
LEKSNERAACTSALLTDRDDVVIEKRVVFDFAITFSNGGGVQGQDFRLDIPGSDIEDAVLAAHVIRDLRLLMVAEARILKKRIIAEPHKRSEPTVSGPARAPKLVDLSHTIEAGMTTYKGLPGPIVCDFLSRLSSRARYAPGTEFQIDRIDMVGNTGTYLDTPFHRFADGYDLDGLALDRAANLPAIVIRLTGTRTRAIGWEALAAADVKDKAVLIHTGWDTRWRSEAYFTGHPFLTEQAAALLRDRGARLVGIDSLNIDDTDDPRRPVHTELLAAGIPIVEHLTHLEGLPTSGLRFTAAPPRIRRMGTFPVRAHAVID